MSIFVNKSDFVNSSDFTKITNKLRSFFLKKNFLEVHTQNRLSILAACEDPSTISTYNFNGIKWPLPQTGQMWLEYELLENPEYEGVFCLSTSYRQEPNPIPGRHNLIFPMFEFESRGNLDDLMNILSDLCVDLGFAENINKIMKIDYLDLAKDFGVKELTHKEESEINKRYKNPVVFIKNFPEYTSPYWNMKRCLKNGLAKKVDVIIGGIETMGCAEREIDVKTMKERFHSISNGEYANLLYNHFGKERVTEEMEKFLSLPMIQRYGAGIGVTRLMKNYKALKPFKIMQSKPLNKNRYIPTQKI